MKEETKTEPTTRKEPIIGWAAAAEVSGRAVPFLRRQLGKGVLRSERNAAGEHVFERSDLEALRPSPVPVPAEFPPLDGVQAGGDTANLPPVEVDTDGISAETYSSVYADLEAGKTIAAIVIDRKLLPETVEKIVAKWRKGKSVDLNGPGVPAELERLRAELRTVKEAWTKAVKVVNDWATEVKDLRKKIGEPESDLNTAVSEARDASANLAERIGKLESTRLSKDEIPELVENLVQALAKAGILVGSPRAAPAPAMPLAPWGSWPPR